RRFRIKSVAGQDDYASHQEVLRRRFRRALEREEGGAEQLRWRLPDLVIIDGGKGQVSAARAVLDELGLHDLPMAGLAKEREELFVPGRSEPIVLPAASQALYLLQRLRDEAHRFAITYHRQLRGKAATRSALDDLAGVGPARKRALLRVFGSSRALKGATTEEIAAVPGIGAGLAERIREHLDG
ncbi:MAG: helix-hairpin-helix domain-containing protein, partial [Candidatus Limnocylindrales bacterium]